jgi:hypothetical protein
MPERAARGTAVLARARAHDAGGVVTHLPPAGPGKETSPIGHQRREDMESVEPILDALMPQNLGQGWPCP